MRMVSYYALHTFMNSIKKMFRSTVMIVFATVISVGIIFGVAAVIVSGIVDNDTEISQEVENPFAEGELTNQETSQTIIKEENAASEDNWEEGGMDAAMADNIKVWTSAGIILFVIAFLLWGIYAGSKKGSDIFLMADVNFLFTAPIRPQSVLMFRLSFQMAATLLGSVYLIFQIPNLVGNLGLSMFTVVIIFTAWVMILILQKLLSVLSYTLASTHEKLKSFIVPFILVVSAVILFGTGITYLMVEKDILKTLSILYASDWSDMIPMIGWYKGMIMAAVAGETTTSFVYLMALLVGMMVLFFIIWHIKADFYEDAMTGAATRNEVMSAAKEGRKKAVKERSEKISRNAGIGGFGASVFFRKEIYNRKRFAKFGFLTNTMLTYLAIGVCVPFFTQKVLEMDGFLVSGIVLAGTVFFRNYGNPIAVETAMNWLYLVPESPYKKVFYAMAAGTWSCALDVLPALVVGMLLTKEAPVTMLLWFVMLVTMDFMLSNVGMILEMFFPASALDVVKSMLQMILKMMMIIIIMILFAVGSALASIWLGLLLNILMNILVGGAIFWIYPSMLHDGV